MEHHSLDHFSSAMQSLLLLKMLSCLYLSASLYLSLIYPDLLFFSVYIWERNLRRVRPCCFVTIYSFFSISFRRSLLSAWLVRIILFFILFCFYFHFIVFHLFSPFIIIIFFCFVWKIWNCENSWNLEQSLYVRHLCPSFFIVLLLANWMDTITRAFICYVVTWDVSENY